MESSDVSMNSKDLQMQITSAVSLTDEDWKSFLFLDTWTVLTYAFAIGCVVGVSSLTSILYFIGEVWH